MPQPLAANPAEQMRLTETDRQNPPVLQLSTADNYVLSVHALACSEMEQPESRPPARFRHFRFISLRRRPPPLDSPQRP